MFGAPGYAGPSPDQVVFNLYTGGTLDANNNGNNAHPNNIMYGIFLDPNGTISFVNTRLVGRIWGGDSHDMQIVSGDTITQPQQHVPEPATLTMVGAAVLGLAVATAVRNARRQ